MIVIFALLLINIVLLRSYSKERQSLLIIFLLVFGIVFSAGVIHYIELQFLGKVTYGSDAQYYWDNAVSVVLDKNTSGIGYVKLLRLLLSSSFDNFIMVILMNSLLYTTSGVIFYIIIIRRCGGVYYNNSWYFLIFYIFLLCNGINIWTVIKGVKETYLIFLIISFIYLMDFTKRGQSLTIKVFLYILIFYISFLANSVREGIIVIMFLSFFVHQRLSYLIDHQEKITIRHVLFLNKKWVLISAFSVFCLTLILLWPQIVSYYNYFSAYVQLSNTEFHSQQIVYANSATIGGFFINSLRFLLGPGPLRALQQVLFSDVFEASTKFGDILVLIGSIEWWIVLFLLLFGFLKIGKRMARLSVMYFDILIFVLFHFLIYVIAYGGTGDTRHRAYFYILLIPIILAVVSKSISKEYPYLANSR